MTPVEQTSLFDPFPTLTTPRLTLREMTLDDAEDHFRIRAHPEVMKYGASLPDTKVDEAIQRINVVREHLRAGTGIRWAITDRASGAFLGSGGFWRWDKRHFRAEIGYELAYEHWGKGIMTEALRAMLPFGFEVMQLHSVEASIEPNNKGSARVLEKVGFRQEGYYRENFYLNGVFSDTAVFSLLKPWLLV